MRRRSGPLTNSDGGHETNDAKDEHTKAGEAILFR
jgi:hypothetical protein